MRYLKLAFDTISASIIIVCLISIFGLLSHGIYIFPELLVVIFAATNWLIGWVMWRSER